MSSPPEHADTQLYDTLKQRAQRALADDQLILAGALLTAANELQLNSVSATAAANARRLLRGYDRQQPPSSNLLRTGEEPQLAFTLDYRTCGICGQPIEGLERHALVHSNRSETTMDHSAVATSVPIGTAAGYRPARADRYFLERAAGEAIATVARATVAMPVDESQPDCGGCADPKCPRCGVHSRDA